MEHGHDDFKRGFAIFVRTNGNATTIIFDGNRLIGIDRNLNMFTMSGQSFVYGVIHDFIHKVMIASLSSIANVHAWSFANGFEPLEDLNLIRSVGRITGIR
jgi:hypothetical protein